MSRPKSKSLTIALLPGLAVLVVGAVALLLMILLNQSWRSNLGTYLPQAERLAQAQVWAAEAHLWFEEVTAGDSSIPMEQIWARLRMASFAMEQVLEGHAEAAGLHAQPMEDARLRDRFEEVAEGLEVLRLGMVGRRQAGSLGGIGSDMDQSFDVRFTQIQDDMRELGLELSRRFSERLQREARLFWINLAALAVLLAAGAGWLIYLGLRREKAERHRRRLEDQLRQAAKMEAIGTLAGGIAHDFNNILTAIVGYTELALEEAQRGRVEPRNLRQVLSAAGRARNLVGQILSFSRKSEVVRQAVEPNHLVQEVIALLAETIPRMIQVDLELGEKAPLVMADPGQIMQVVMNLCANAVDAMPEGGRLGISTGVVALDREFTRERMVLEPGAYLLMRVSDNGQGMEEEVVARIFEPFFTTKDLGKGTGLGLSSSFGIVRRHGGQLSCYSQPGQGTEFHVYLPAAPDGTEVVQPTPPEAAAAASLEGRVLLVDDEAVLRDIGRTMLSRLGLTVFTAATGEEAISAHAELGGELDLVILDLSMPGMGGAQAMAELLRADPCLRIILCSGYSRDARVEDLLAAGAAGFLPKPFSRDDLECKLAEVLACPAPGETAQDAASPSPDDGSGKKGEPA